MDFQNTMPLPPMAAAPAAPAAARMRAEAPRHGGESLPLQFTGSGSEYFRIWIVNLLLTIVTLGFYHPFAKVRRLRYFHGNTLVGGHALGFHGDPWKMLRGYVLMLVFGAVYVGAGQFSALAGAIAGAAFALLWPALWQSSLRFRLANTSWRGLRMRFSGDLAGAYGAMLPLLLPLAVMLLTSAGVGQPGSKPSMLRLTVAGLSTVALMLLVPWTLARIKRYQHGHYELAGERTELDARTRSFYGWAVGTLLVSLVPLALVFAGLFLIAPSNAGRIGGDVMLRNSGLFVLLLLAGYLAMFLVSQSWGVARLQNLVWSHTRSPRLRFRSRLGTLAMMGMLLKNLVLTVITLGLYRPFAVVAMTRLRLHAVGIDAAGDIEQWSAAAIARGTPEAAGDAAGDLLGIDIGL
ncbi:YjgN family protein [Aquabacterium humicola]|uniref:YjgN family protein n=1 Tax=Aquabacterium humicola TaxID=3237377 RepID=UPI0025437749|nr:YjgN family protein [Rubrivivax pictus]